MTREAPVVSVMDDIRMTELYKKNGWKMASLKRMWRYFVQRGATTLGEVPDFPKAVHKELSQAKYGLMTTSVVSVSDCADRSTTKLLIQLQDGQLVESVIMRYDKRATLCISSQVGCRMACRFCSTGTMGLRGNLTCGEMIEQAIHANRIAKIRNVVFMGMGEPLDNYNEVLGALRALLDPGRFGLAAAHVTVSTVGVVPRIRSLCKDAPGVSLALSLHAPNQELRCKIVPTARAWPLDVLMAAVDDFSAHCDTPVLVEYVVLGGVNDQPEHAHQLGQLLSGRKMTLNLIPYNPSVVPDKLEQPTHDAVSAFREICMKDYKIFTTVRREMGQDIAGACGQLVVATEAKLKAAACSDGGKCSPGRESVTTSVAQFDIEDLGSRSSAKPTPAVLEGSSSLHVSPAATKAQGVTAVAAEATISPAPGSPDPLIPQSNFLELVSWGCIAVGALGLLWRLKTRL